jgi:hypothetical protein
MKRNGRNVLRVADLALWGDVEAADVVFHDCTVCHRPIRQLAKTARRRTRHPGCAAAKRATNYLPPRNYGDADLPAREIERIIASDQAAQRDARRRAQ